MTDSIDGRKPFQPKRRRVLAGLAASASGLALGASGLQQAAAVTAPSAKDLPPLPPPADCGIDHIVVVMMENRSFDHIFGWAPGVDGIQSGLNFVDSDGTAHSTYNLAPDFQNCTSADPDHTYNGGRTHVDGGAMDGFLLTQPVGDTFPIGYYTGDVLPFYSGCSANWTVCDRYFSGILSQTYPNRIYMHAGQTDRNDDSLSLCTLPTIWDSLSAANVHAAYYYSDVPITALWGGKYLHLSRTFERFELDAKLGRLPSVSYIDPAFIGEGDGVSRDDHPFADIRDGQAFLNRVYDAVRCSPNWPRTLMIVNYDEWGGFFDHMVPPYAPVTAQEYAAIGNDGSLGIRVPAIAISPRALRGAVQSTQFDPNSILNMICWRYGMAPLGARASSTNFAYALDFSAPPNLHAPAFAVPERRFGSACQAPASGTQTAQQQELMRRRDEHLRQMRELQALARSYGFAG